MTPNGAVLAVTMHRQMRTATDYLIFSLALADLLIIVFCLPSTLLNTIVSGESESDRLYCVCSLMIRVCKGRNESSLFPFEEKIDRAKAILPY